ncbi:CCN family member 2-like isoform X2 [Pseudophryne corroboree]
MVLDPCGCGCRVCIQELGAECDGLRPCDPTKNLTCDYQGDPDRQRGLCKETEEDPVPPTDPPMCKTNTDWTPCSRSCGFGNSVRITYEKESCTPKVERRLCMIRPCKGQYASANYTVLKSSSVCNRVTRWSQPLHLHYRGCVTDYPQLPRFCGHCSDGRLCYPSMSETRHLSFQCPHRGRDITHNVMLVVRCQCGGKRGKKRNGNRRRANSGMQSGEETAGQ